MDITASSESLSRLPDSDVIASTYANAIGPNANPPKSISDGLSALMHSSPEQAGQAGEDIDTRSDVYSLGVVLYEPLVGALPLDFRKRVVSLSITHKYFV